MTSLMMGYKQENKPRARDSEITGGGHEFQWDYLVRLRVEIQGVSDL